MKPQSSDWQLREVNTPHSLNTKHVFVSLWLLYREQVKGAQYRIERRWIPEPKTLATDPG